MINELHHSRSLSTIKSIHLQAMTESQGILNRLNTADITIQDRSALHNPLLCIGYCEYLQLQSGHHHILGYLLVRTSRMLPHCMLLTLLLERALSSSSS